MLAQLIKGEARNRYGELCTILDTAFFVDTRTTLQDYNTLIQQITLRNLRNQNRHENRDETREMVFRK